MPTAKSFLNFEKLCEPFESSGRMYIKVRNPKTGTERTVRWYTDIEYAKMYPEEKIDLSKTKTNQRKCLGFGDKGYITIFKGVTDANEEWFRMSIARFATCWGWYIISDDEIPEDLPKNVTPVTLKWEAVGLDQVLKPDAEVRRVIQNLLLPPSNSKFIGNIGERNDYVLTVKHAIPLETSYGSSTLHIFEDMEENVFTWLTAARTLEVGHTYKVRGTIKKHEAVKNECRTVLTRCKVDN